MRKKKKKTWRDEMAMQGRNAELLVHGVVEKDTLLSKLELPGNILITTADPNRSGKRGRSGGWVDLK